MNVGSSGLLCIRRGSNSSAEPLLGTAGLRELARQLGIVDTGGRAANVLPRRTMKFYSDDDFDRVLCDSPPGIFDVRSWTFWNLHFRHEPVPPLPLRKLPSADNQRAGAA